MTYDETLANELLDGRYPCVLTTLAQSGAPHSVVTWCARDGHRILVNGTDSVAWMRYVRRDPRVSVLILDTEDILRYANFRGRVSDIREDEDFVQMDGMARVYDGTERYVWQASGSVVRYVVTIEPELARTHDPVAPPEVRRGPTRVHG